MIDAYTIGITLALDNGVSEGLATIRRDLIALNGVVEGSGTRLKYLTHAAAGLQIHPGTVDPGNKDSTAPVRRHDDGAVSIPSGSSSLDPGVFAPSRSALLAAARTLMPQFSGPAIVPVADVGMLRASLAGMMSSEIQSLDPNLAMSAPFINQHSGQDAAVGDFAPVCYTPQALSPTPTRTAPADGSADRQFIGPSAAFPPSAVTNALSPPSAPAGPNISVSQGDGGPSSRPLQRQAVGTPLGFSQIAHIDQYSTPFRPHPTSVDPTMPSAVPPPSELQATPSQGDVYVDGSRLGRWMTDHLVKVAELPRAAATGFDPRLTPTWPGASVSA